MKRLSHSRAVKIAASISFLLGLFAFIFALPLLALGAEAIETNQNTPPYFVLVWGFIFGIVRILAAYGTWRNQRWSILATILASVADGLFAVPGILFAPTTTLWWLAMGTTALAIIIIVLCLWRDRRPIVP